MPMTSCHNSPIGIQKITLKKSTGQTNADFMLKTCPSSCGFSGCLDATVWPIGKSFKMAQRFTSPAWNLTNILSRSSENWCSGSMKKSFWEMVSPFSREDSWIVAGMFPLICLTNSEVMWHLPMRTAESNSFGNPSLVVWFLLCFFLVLLKKVWKLTTKGYYISVFGLVVFRFDSVYANISDIHPLFYVNHNDMLLPSAEVPVFLQKYLPLARPSWLPNNTYSDRCFWFKLSLRVKRVRVISACISSRSFQFLSYDLTLDVIHH